MTVPHKNVEFYMSYGDLPAILLSDCGNIILDQLNSSQLKKLSETSKALKTKIRAYVDAYLKPYNFSWYSQSQYCPESEIYDKNARIPDLEHAKRAMALAVTFRLCGVGHILHLNPETRYCVIETRSVTIHNPRSKTSFTADWHFKLSHLLACEGLGYTGLTELVNSYIFYRAPEIQEDMQKEIQALFSEAIEWECKDDAGQVSRGTKGPTAAAIAILYQHPDFFHDLEFYNCKLAPDEGCDEPYKHLNPCYLLLQQMSVDNHHVFRSTLMGHYPDSPLLIECVASIFSEALEGNYALLEVFLSAAASWMRDIPKYVKPHFPKVIEANNLHIIAMLTEKISKVHQAFKGEANPLFLATKLALGNEEYLPMVKHFLCRGYMGAATPLQLLKHSKPIGNYPFFGRASPIYQELVNYFKISKDLRSMIFNYKNTHKSDLAHLVLTFNRDKGFFNELILAWLEYSENACSALSMHDSTHESNHAKFKKHYYECLRELIAHPDISEIFTPETLQGIGIAWEPWCCESPEYFYQAALDKVDISETCRASIEEILRRREEYRVEAANRPKDDCRQS